MIHLPAAVPQQLPGVHIHMKQRAVIIRPRSAEAEEQAGRAPGWDGFTHGARSSSHEVQPGPGPGCRGHPHPASAPVLPGPSRRGWMRPPTGAKKGMTALQGSVETPSRQDFTCISPMGTLYQYSTS